MRPGRGRDCTNPSGNRSIGAVPMATTGKPNPMTETDWSHEEALDLRDLACPLPVLAVRKKLQKMTPGSRLYVEATDPMAAIDIPHFCKEAGHRLLARQLGDPPNRFLIERG